jgi:type VI secretion system protein ImpA
MPAEAAPEAGGADEAQGEPGEGGAPARGGRRGLSGSVTSREEALRAIDLVCEYLERAEPTNPATLFLRRARHLVNHNFLQLMKELAPDALPEVARIVGVDPDTVQTPQSP